MELTEDIIINELMNITQTSKGGLSGLEARLHESKLYPQILEDHIDAEKWREFIAEYADVETGELKESVLQQIKNNKEKAEKYDKYPTATEYMNKQEKLEQENKELKEILETKEESG